MFSDAKKILLANNNWLNLLVGRFGLCFSWVDITVG
jgi:hypothetical protein